MGDAFDSLRTIRVPAKDGRSGQDIQLQYSHQKVIGNGSFGVVYQVKLDRNGEDAAIKKVLQDKRFKVNFGTINTVHSHLINMNIYIYIYIYIYIQILRIENLK